MSSLMSMVTVHENPIVEHLSSYLTSYLYWSKVYKNITTPMLTKNATTIIPQLPRIKYNTIDDVRLGTGLHADMSCCLNMYPSESLF